jgi:hypothetical protein
VNQIIDKEKMKKTTAQIILFMIPPVPIEREYRLRVNGEKTSSKQKDGFSKKAQHEIFHRTAYFNLSK